MNVKGHCVQCGQPIIELEVQTIIFQPNKKEIVDLNSQSGIVRGGEGLPVYGSYWKQHKDTCNQEWIKMLPKDVYEKCLTEPQYRMDDGRRIR